MSREKNLNLVHLSLPYLYKFSLAKGRQNSFTTSPCHTLKSIKQGKKMHKSASTTRRRMLLFYHIPEKMDINMQSRLLP